MQVWRCLLAFLLALVLLLTGEPRARTSAPDFAVSTWALPEPTSSPATSPWLR